MAKQSFQPNQKVRQIFEDLENYLEFCKDYGYKFDESTMYDMRNYVFRQFTKALSNKPARDQWAEAINR
jgi:hypothetical protein